MSPTTKSPTKPLRFRFVSLKDVGFFFDNEDTALPKLNSHLDDLNINIDASARFIPDEKLVAFTIVVTYLFGSEDSAVSSSIILQYKSRTTFYIDNFEEIFTPIDGDGFKADRKVSRMLIGIALSTIRGVLIAKTANSYFNDYPLPIIHPDIIKRVEGVDSDDEAT